VKGSKFLDLFTKQNIDSPAKSFVLHAPLNCHWVALFCIPPILDKMQMKWSFWSKISTWFLIEKFILTKMNFSIQNHGDILDQNHHFDQNYHFSSKYPKNKFWKKVFKLLKMPKNRNFDIDKNPKWLPSFMPPEQQCRNFYDFSDTRGGFFRSELVCVQGGGSEGQFFDKGGQ